MDDLSKIDFLGKELMESPMRWDYSLFSFAFSEVDEDKNVLRRLRGTHHRIQTSKSLSGHMEKINKTSIQAPQSTNPNAFYFFYICLKLNDSSKGFCLKLVFQGSSHNNCGRIFFAMCINTKFQITL